MRFDKHKYRAYFLICMMITHCTWAAQSKSALDSIKINSFLNLMTNEWKGTAVQTPIGPVKYNIKFAEDSRGHVAGAAYLGRAIHYWDFYQELNQLNLKFLTTFAGNKEPIIFKSNCFSDEGFEFTSTSRDGVKVIINPENEKIFIRIFLRDKAHVKIELAI